MSFALARAHAAAAALAAGWAAALGQADLPYARRTAVTGVLAAPVMVFWNIEKK